MVFDGITELLVQEGGVELRNFGIFQVKERKAREARKPRTGEGADLEERTARHSVAESGASTKK
ncbi:hypothetical protein AYO40_05250 [Planctomycetaceae bacterium SCGC AG-212-D15]|nr:hypothetical protein AYO40_05250 [Planctomycetaceae bacterium SCGC AG-212-D15]